MSKMTKRYFGSVQLTKESQIDYFSVWQNAGLKILGIFPSLLYAFNKLQNKWNRLLVFPLLTTFRQWHKHNKRRTKERAFQAKIVTTQKFFSFFLLLLPMAYLNSWAYLLSHTKHFRIIYHGHFSRRFILKQKRITQIGRKHIILFLYFYGISKYMLFWTFPKWLWNVGNRNQV